MRTSIILAIIIQMTTVIIAAAAATTTTRRTIASSSCFLSSSSPSSSSMSGASSQLLPPSFPVGRRRMRSPGAEEDADDDFDSDATTIATTATTDYIPPWSLPHLRDKSSTSYARFRQHVNPLARRYRMSAHLPDGWPNVVYDDPTLPLFLDVGCGKGGFLLEMAGRGRGRGASQGRNVVDDDDDEDGDGVIDDDDVAREGSNSTRDESPPSSSHWQLPPSLNYLGLEIRPGVSQYAQSRVSKRGLDGTVSFVGCNANVDLDRILTLYRESSSSSSSYEEGIDDRSTITKTTALPVVSFVAIQFPDPHFKKAHAKRRVVTFELVTTLAKFVVEGGGVFLQSDVRGALEAMREKFVEGGDDDVFGVGRRYFDEWTPTGYDGDDVEEYGMENPLGVPTEREGSVLNRGLPVFRTLFRRNSVPFET